MSENVKSPFESNHEKLSLARDTASSIDPAGLDDTEAQMRRALGLGHGDQSPRPRSEPERTDPPVRGTDRFGFGGHKRRFVQDGDVPVTILRRDSATDASKTSLTGPSASRLQRAEAALAAERSARERAERTLADVQAQLRDAQTKLGHADLSRNEAVELARREREGAAELRAAVHAHDAQLREARDHLQAAEERVAELQQSLLEERSARKAAERTLHTAETARLEAERLLQDMTEAVGRPALTVSAAKQNGHAAGGRTRAGVMSGRAGKADPAPQAEPEPVKWWLSTRPASRR